MRASKMIVTAAAAFVLMFFGGASGASPALSGHMDGFPLILGSGFSTESYVEEGFEFAFSHPSSWAGRVATPQCSFSGRCKQVVFRKSSEVSSVEAELTLQFVGEARVSGQDLTSLEQLEGELRRLFPDQQWSPLQQGYALGFQSRQMNSNQAESSWAFLSGVGQVVLVQSIYPEGSVEAVELEGMMQSIRRTTEPPTVLSVRSLSSSPLSAGDQSCWQVEAADVAGHLTPESLSEFLVVGDFSQKGLWKTVRFSRSRQRPTEVIYNLCYEVTAAQATEHLVLESFRIVNSRSVPVECRSQPGAEDSLRFLCGNGRSEHTTRRPTAVVTQPDRESPQVLSARLTANGILHLRLQDSSSIATLQLIYRADQQQIELLNTEPGTSEVVVKVAPQASFGRITLQELWITDQHGWITALGFDGRAGHYVEFRNHALSQSAPIAGRDQQKPLQRVISRPDLTALTFWKGEEQ